MKRGFYFFTPKMEYFFVTKQTRKTEQFCDKVYQSLLEHHCAFVYGGMYHGSFGDFSIHDKLEACTLEIKHTEKFGDYYDIVGANCSAGSFVEDNKLTIVELD